MSKTIREHICNIQVEKSNLEHIAKTGEINGSLLISIEKAMRDYIQSQTQDLQEQNAELVEMLLQSSERLYTVESPSTSCRYLADEITELLTKHNHLKSNTNG